MNFTELFTQANTETGGLYGVSLPFVILVIVYVGLSGYGFSRAFSGASFSAFVAGLTLFAFGIVPDYVMMILLVFVLAGTLMLLRKE